MKVYVVMEHGYLFGVYRTREIAEVATAGDETGAFDVFESEVIG